MYAKSSSLDRYFIFRERNLGNDSTLFSTLYHRSLTTYTLHANSTTACLVRLWIVIMTLLWHFSFQSQRPLRRSTFSPITWFSSWAFYGSSPVWQCILFLRGKVSTVVPLCLRFIAQQGPSSQLSVIKSCSVFPWLLVLLQGDGTCLPLHIAVLVINFFWHSNLLKSNCSLNGCVAKLWQNSESCLYFEFREFQSMTGDLNKCFVSSSV